MPAIDPYVRLLLQSETDKQFWHGGDERCRPSTQNLCHVLGHCFVCFSFRSHTPLLNWYEVKHDIMMPGELYSGNRYAKLKFDIVFTWIKSRFTTILPNVLLVTQLVWPSVD